MQVSLLSAALLLAEQSEGPPWWLFPLFALIGLVMFGIGSYGIATRRALIGGRQKRMLRLFGIEEITGTWAVVIGVGQCLAGCIALGAAIVGPFVAGSLTDNETPSIASRADTARVATPASQPVPESPPNAAPQSREPEIPSGESTPALESPNVSGADQPSPRRLRFVAGSDRGEAFRDQAPVGGLLVGLRCSTREDWGGVLQAVEPVYQVGGDYQLGSRFGAPGGDEAELIARAGYAVGGINVRTGAMLNAVQLVFFRINGRTLDASDNYLSEWLGCDGGQLYLLEPPGPITEVFGSLEECLVSLGFQAVEELEAAVPLPNSSPPDLFAAPRPGRMLGLREGLEFGDQAPTGAALVGVRAFCDPQPKPTVHSIRPIYLSEDGYSEGETHGSGGEYEAVVIARPGFAVGGVEYHRFANSAGLRLLFVKVAAEGLDPQESYHSPWLGYPWDEHQQKSDSGQRFVGGLTGYTDEVPNGIGLMPVSPRFVRWPSESIPLTAELQRAASARPPLQASHPNGAPFSDTAPDGGLLMGFRLWKGKNWGGALQAIQPIYQVGDQVSHGKRYGQPGGEEHELLAKAGYAVGAVHARAGLVLNALQLVYYRIDGRRLDPRDNYSSEWIGCDGGGPSELDPQGDPIIRLFGTHQQDLVSLGIEPIAELPEASSGQVPQDDEPEAGSPFRIWRSAGGGAQVEAKMLVADDTAVQLERRDGKRVTVPLSKLSEADITFVQETRQNK